MMASAPVTNVTNNEYIILSQGPYAIITIFTIIIKLDQRRIS